MSQQSSGSPNQHDEQHGEHIVPISVYVAVFITLLLLTGLTTGVAYIDLGPFNTVAALVIACAKMLLVVLFFMHVKYSSGLTKLVVIAGIFWLGILLTLTLTDYHSRGWTPVPQPWSNPGLILPFLFHWF